MRDEIYEIEAGLGLSTDPGLILQTQAKVYIEGDETGHQITGMRYEARGSNWNWDQALGFLLTLVDRMDLRDSNSLSIRLGNRVRRCEVRHRDASETDCALMVKDNTGTFSEVDSTPLSAFLEKDQLDALIEQSGLQPVLE